ncbi:MAG: hypothetical protein WCW13_02190 [archaeon]|jgi:O-methyltransferase involved in polyketide biosynthesis
MTKSSHLRVAPTAYSVARSRALSDIPFAKEIAQWMGKELGDEERIVYDAYEPKQVVTLEARYKLIDKLILQHNPTQVLELACGLLPRGYLFSKQGITYVETDLKDMVLLKQKMYRAVFPALPKNLFLEEANALSKRDLSRVAKHFDKKKSLIIMHEGLLRYLNFKEKTLVAKNIHSLLEEFGGVWITSDITLKKMLPAKTLKKIKERIGMDVSQNAFSNIREAQTFFENLGFEIKVHCRTEIQSELSTPKLLHLNKQEVKRMLEYYVVEMSVKH